MPGKKVDTTPNGLGIHLQYTFEPSGQSGALVENPLFDLLAALQAHGSIKHAALAMDRSYRHVWGEVRHWEQVLGEALVTWEQGKRATLTPFSLRLLWAERQARSRLTPHLEALRAELRLVLAKAHDESFDVVDMLASHDLQLPRLQSLVEQQKVRLSLRFAGSAEALRQLNAGGCDLAGFHVPQLKQGAAIFKRALRPLLKPGQHKLIGSHRRMQGLMFRPSDASHWSGAKPLEALKAAESRWRFVNRHPGSGTRLLMEHLLSQADVAPDTIEGWDTRFESTHVAVAACIAAGQADVGLGIEAAAAELGLGFLPLIEEDYFLVCLKSKLKTPAVQRLREALASAAWARTLATLPGYAPHCPGEVLSLTAALPWWAFARAKHSVSVPS